MSREPVADYSLGRLEAVLADPTSEEFTHEIIFARDTARTQYGWQPATR